MPPRRGISHPRSPAALLHRPDESENVPRVSAIGGYRARPFTSRSPSRSRLCAALEGLVETRMPPVRKRFASHGTARPMAAVRPTAAFRDSASQRGLDRVRPRGHLRSKSLHLPLPGRCTRRPGDAIAVVPERCDQAPAHLPPLAHNRVAPGRDAKSASLPVSRRHQANGTALSGDNRLCTSRDSGDSSDVRTPAQSPR